MNPDDVTPPTKSPAPPPDGGPLSLPFDPASLAQGIRVRPAQFARMCNVTRQTVSRWVKNGLVQLYPDGTLDPAASSRRVIEQTDPARLRARIFRDALKGRDELQAEARSLAGELAAAKKEIVYLCSINDHAEIAFDLFRSKVSHLLGALAPDHQADIAAQLDNLTDTCWFLAYDDLPVVDLDSIHATLVALLGNDGERAGQG